MKTGRFVAELTSLPAFEPEREGWSALAREAIEPNPFYEPGFLMACVRHLERPDTIILLVVRDTARNNRPVGLFPLCWPRLRDGILFGAISLYRNPYTSLSTPLIHADCVPEVLDAAFGLLSAPGGQADVIHMPLISASRPFGAALAAYCTARGLPQRIGGQFERAAIETTLSLSEYQHALGKNTRKSLARKLRRLEERGPVAFTTIRKNSPDGQKALDEFLYLESLGWKGQRGTALASKPQTRAFALSAFGTGNDGPDLFFERLSVNGRAVAMNVNLIAQRVVYTIKTAYDEAYGDYSPGALLDWNTIRFGTAGAGIARLDSCADPGHRIEIIWRERESIATLIVGVTEAVAPARLDRIETGMRWMSRAIGGAKALRDKFAGAA